MALSISGDAYGWGWGKEGQLGGDVYEGSALVSVPRLLLPRSVSEKEDEKMDEEEEDVVMTQIGAGACYTAAYSSSKRCIYVWGKVGLVSEGKEEMKEEEKRGGAWKWEGGREPRLVCGEHHLHLLEAVAEREPERATVK